MALTLIITKIVITSKMRRIQYIYALSIILVMSMYSCQDELVEHSEPVDTENIITVGVDATGLLSLSSSMTPIEQNVTRAVGETKPAEEVSWLVQPLKKGLDIKYGRVPTSNNPEKHENVAILKLSETSGPDITMKGEAGNQYATNTNSGYAIYSFAYRTNGDPAKWYDNGPHYFEGVHVPNRIRYSTNASEIESDRQNFNGVESVAKVTDLTKDQSGNVESGEDNELSNYYLLAHYLGMPANTQISATVSRILLPFRHRLAHVLAYIIIDPALGANIQGYANINANDDTKPFRDDPKTSSILFCNVDMLKGVKDAVNDGVHTLTPTWEEKVRKVIPHFYEQAEEVIVYESTKKKIYPKSEGYDGENGVHTKYTNAYNAAKAGNKTDEQAAAAAKTACGGYEQKKYFNVPVYDLIVRPTYRSYDNVMYDEEGYSDERTRQNIANKTNKIDFQVGLENGLNYEKEFVFDLDANHETVVYLHISREGVDYNDSGSELWQETPVTDDYYGVDNQNGHTLSKAGSSWQRAFYNTTLHDTDSITDGGFYDERTKGEDGTAGQYLTDATWTKYFLEAHEGGAHHGDYFVLANDITINAAELPSDGLVFTGHLDGFTTYPHPGNGYHTITLNGAGGVTQCTAIVTDYLSKLYEDAGATNPVPQLYWYQEIAQAPGRRNAGSIPWGEPIMIPMGSSLPSLLDTYDNQGKIVFWKDGNEFKLYTKRTFYKKAPAFLFAGLNGVYTTAQETATNPYAAGVTWEANVHKEGNYWLPYRDVSGTNPSNTGWRAEVMNVKLQGGASLFAGDVLKYEDTDNDPKTPEVLTGYNVTKVSGYVYNCKDVDGTVKVLDHTPAMPRYK